MNLLSPALSTNPVSLIAVLLGLMLFGVLYAAAVRSLRNRKREHGQTAWLVVVGNSAVIVAFGLLAGIAAAVLLTACMAAAGVPMILEYVDDYLRSQEKEKNTLELN